MPYIVKTEIVNPFGVCSIERAWARLGGNTDIYISGIRFDVYTLIRDYISRVYNIPISEDQLIRCRLVTTNESEYDHLVRPRSWGFINTSSQIPDQSFETEAEALEYVDTLGNPDPIITIPSPNDVGHYPLFTADWDIEIDGIMVTRNVELNYTGERVELYTIDDLINFFALFFGITYEEVYEYITHEPGNPSLGCETYIRATVFDIDGPGGTIEVDIDFTGGSIPGDVTVTTIDGDPVVFNTMLENGDGSVNISDSGNITMLNDGGTFFLNEFGNVGFYANGDASLTADNQVQLGVGQNSVTVENGSLTIRDETGSATLTAEDINNLKDLLS